MAARQDTREHHNSAVWLTDHAGEDAKVNFWEAPTEVSRWKEEHVSSRLSTTCFRT